MRYFGYGAWVVFDKILKMISEPKMHGSFNPGSFHSCLLDFMREILALVTSSSTIANPLIVDQIKKARICQRNGKTYLVAHCSRCNPMARSFRVIRLQSV